jgi:two-component system, NtrC family, response regulator HydG
MTAMRVLLVEDEEVLRQLLEKYLLRIGYEVDTASSAEAALLLFNVDRDGYNLILADLSLPGMHGDELMMRVLQASPSIRVLLSSGYPHDLGYLDAADRKRVAFLQKPYLPRQLADHIKQILPQASKIAG